MMCVGPARGAGHHEGQAITRGRGETALLGRGARSRVAAVLLVGALLSVVVAGLGSMPVSAGTSTFVSIAAGVDFGLALKTDGTVLSWGSNFFGQLGNGGSPAQVVTPTVIPGLSNVVAVAAGQWSAMALKKDGTVWAWGDNHDGQVATGSFTPSVAIPTQITALSGITAIAAGGGIMGAVKSDGTVWAWGDNALGELGNGLVGSGTTTGNSLCCFASPQQVQGLTGVTSIAMGGSHTIAIRSDGSAWSWGFNLYGQLGNGTLAKMGCSCVSTAAPIPGIMGVTAAAAANDSSLLIKGDGTVWTMGRAQYGPLGTGNTTTDTPTPAQVPGISNAVGASGHAGGYSLLVVLSSGAVVGWGMSDNGELLNNMTTPAITPTPTPAAGLPPSTTVAVAGGFEWSMALETDGTVWSAGLNTVGQLGQGYASTDRSTCQCVPTTAQSMVNTFGIAAAITLLHGNPDPSGDPYYTDTYSPGQDQQFSVVVTGSLASAFLYIDGIQQQSILSSGSFTWMPTVSSDGLYRSHTFVVYGSDSAGNPVSSQALALFRLVQVEGDAISILPENAVQYNPFEADPFDVKCLDQLPGTAACAGAPPPAPSLFRQLNGGILRGKADGTSFSGTPQFLRNAKPGTSYYCDNPGATAAINQNSGQSGPFTDGTFTGYTSTLETRVNVTIPNIFGPFTIPFVPAGVTGPTNQSPFIPWIFSSVYLGISPDGQTSVEWADASGHQTLGNSLFPYHYLYRDRALLSSKPHPTPDLVAWTRTAQESLTKLFDALNSGLQQAVPVLAFGPPPLENLIAGLAPDVFAQQVLFAGERAECARERFAAYYQSKTPNLEDYLQQHFPGFDFTDKWFYIHWIYDDTILPHFTPWEATQGITKAGFVRDYNCLVPGCPGLEYDKAIGVFSPVQVDVYDATGRHVGPIADGSIEYGIPSVTYLKLGHATFLILPNDPNYRVTLTGTGAGLATFNASDYNGRTKLDYAQYESVPVTAHSTGTLTMGQNATPISWDMNGSGSAVPLTPSTQVSNPAPDSVDVTPPTTTATLQGTAGQPGFYRSPVDVSFVGHDDLSGVALTQYSLDGGVTWAQFLTPLHFVNDGSYQVLFRSTDFEGNIEVARTVGFAIDTVAPTVTIAAPNNRPYTLGQTVTANYSCSDAGSGIATCVGTVANSASLDTSSVGSKTFSVTATDRAGNLAMTSVTYTVSYAICPLYDQAKAHSSGSTVPIKVSLCDASGNYVSSSATVVTATGVVETSTNAPGVLDSTGGANPDNNFRFDPTLGTSGGYIYNLSTSGLTTGTYAVNFTVSGDPVPHSVQFEVR